MYITIIIVNKNIPEMSYKKMQCRPPSKKRRKEEKTKNLLLIRIKKTITRRSSGGQVNTGTSYFSCQCSCCAYCNSKKIPVIF
jgi:hypothetical protein